MPLDIQNALLPLPYLTSWIKAGTQCDINALDIFDAMGIEIDLGNLQRATFSPLQLVQALQDCTRAAKAQERAHYPLALGEAIVFDQGPAAEAFLASSPTIRHALALIAWVMPKVNPWFKIELHELDEEAWISFELPFLNSEAPPLRYVIESTMAAFMHIGFGLLGTIAHKPLGLHFVHHRPPYHGQYIKHFQIEPQYGQTQNALYFDRHFLDLPLQGAKAQLHEQAQNILMTQQSPAEQPVKLGQQVVDRLVSQPELLSGDLNQIAQAFGMSSRTMQRRLNKEGQGFSDALKSAQRTLAMRWLADTAVDINTLSTRLGYQSRRAFTSAFKQWTGTTPSDYRTQVRG